MAITTKSKKDQPSNDKDLYLSMLRDFARRHQINFVIMAAICETESNWNTFATRYEARFQYISNPQGFGRINGITADTEKNQQMTSWGIGQIMGATCRGLSYKGPLVRLCEPELGLDYACMYFKKNCDSYPDDSRKIAAYNAGAPRYDRGRLTNQDYVDLVISRLEHYRDY